LGPLTNQQVTEYQTTGPMVWASEFTLDIIKAPCGLYYCANRVGPCLGSISRAGQIFQMQESVNDTSVNNDLPVRRASVTAGRAPFALPSRVSF
jgi:hypothetical protein